jgi:hypothetical protein
VAVGEPIPRRPDEDREALVDRVRDVMEGTLARWRNGDVTDRRAAEAAG